MGELTYSKKIKINNKVIKENDIILFAQLFREQFSEKDYVREIRLFFEDESRIRGNDIDIFSSDEFKRRRCKSVEFDLASSGYERHIQISLNNPVNWLHDSWVEVRSTDKTWYESMLKRMENVIDEMESQVKFTRHPYILSLLISAVEAIIFSLAVPKLLSLKATVYGYVVLTMLSFVVLYILNSILIEGLKKVYPNVEFAFGPTHSNTALKKRKIIGVLIPFGLDIALFILGLLA